MISPSAIVLKGLGLKPVGAEVCPDDNHSMSCAVCGVTMQPGQVIDPMIDAIPSSFTSHKSFADAVSPYRCGDCATVMSDNRFLAAFSVGVFTRTKAYSIRKNVERSWLFLTPPEPPFVVAIQSARMQHVVWRSPVTLSKNLIMVGLGEAHLRIRRDRLLAARETGLELHRLREVATPGRKRFNDVIESPFIVGKDASPRRGELKFWVQELLAAGRIGAAQMNTLTCLNAGEVWALTACLTDPVQPELLDIT